MGQEDLLPLLLHIEETLDLKTENGKNKIFYNLNKISVICFILI